MALICIREERIRTPPGNTIEGVQFVSAISRGWTRLSWMHYARCWTDSNVFVYFRELGVHFHMVFVGL